MKNAAVRVLLQVFASHGWLSKVCKSQGKRILIDVFLVVIQSVRAEEARFLRCLEA
jgi:hypothetical protein